MGTPYLACRQRQFPLWKIKGLTGAKSERPYLSWLKPISAVLFHKDFEDHASATRRC